MLENKKYRAFISYSHADSRWAAWLQKSLEGYRVPHHLIGKPSSIGPIPSRLTPIFRDRDELATAHDLSSSIRNALENSDYLIVICSPAAASSRWVNREVEVFRELGRSDRILCLVVDGDPRLPGSEYDCFPPTLRNQVAANFAVPANPVEPIAADLRKGADGRDLARIKIIAGILGIGLDDLRRREQKRRNRRYLAIATSAVAISLVTIILAVNATLARNEAQQRQLQAEELLSFMVGDLRASLQPLGRLDLLEEVARQAQEYFATVDLSNLSDEELLRQSEILTQLGEISVNRFQYNEALDLFTEAYDRSVAHFENDQRDEARLFNRSQAEFWIGYANLMLGERVTAREWFITYLNSADALYSMNPSNDAWLGELIYGIHNIAALDSQEGFSDSAVSQFEREMALRQELMGRSPSPQLIVEQGDSASWLGNIYLSQGDLQNALEAYSNNEALIRQALETNPDHAIWLDYLATGLIRVADTLLIMGEEAAALPNIIEAHQLFERLLARDPSNTNNLNSKIAASINWAKIDIVRADIGSARQKLTEAIGALETLLEEGIDDQSLRTNLIKAHYWLGWASYLAGDSSSGIENLQLAQERAAQSRESHATTDLSLLASILVTQGEISMELQQYQEAESAFNAARYLLAGEIIESEDPRLLDPWARIHFYQDQTTEALSIISKLQSSGYTPLIPWPSQNQEL